MTSDHTPNDFPGSDMGAYAPLPADIPPCENAIASVPKQQRPSIIFAAIQAVCQPLIAAASYAESCRQLLKRQESLATIAAAIDSTLAEILLAQQGLQQLSERIGRIEGGQQNIAPGSSGLEMHLFRLALDSLTARERQVLSAAVDGLNSLEIADKLSISGRTVESHRANIVRKFDVASLGELFRTAAALGLALAPTEERT